MPLDAKDKEIQQLKEELKAAKDYSQVCEDESVELRRKVFQMSKEMNKLKRDLEQLTRASDKKKPADLTPMPTPAPSTGLKSTSRKRSTRKTMVDTVMLEANASGEGSDSAPSGGDHDMSSTAPRRSARRAGRPPSTVEADLAAAAPVPKRKASSRAAAASVEHEERPAPASSKKKRVDGATSTASSAESECDKVEERPQVQAERVVGETRPVTGCAGGMGEHPDPPSEEDQAAAEPPATASEQMQLLDMLAEANLQQQAAWMPRMKALKRLRLLLTTPGLLKCDRSDFVQKMLLSLVVQSADARSQVVRETCSLITEILPFLDGFYDDVAKILLPQLWKLTYITIKVMSESGGKCLLSLAHVLPVSTFLSSAGEAALDPHAMCRAQAAVCINALLLRCAAERKGGRGACAEEVDVAAICELLPKLLEDTSADVRANSKAAFETLHKNWPERGSSLLSAAPEHVQRALSAAAGGGGGSKVARWAPGKKVDIKEMRLAAMQRRKGEQQNGAGQLGGSADVGASVKLVMAKENFAANRIC